MTDRITGTDESVVGQLPVIVDGMSIDDRGRTSGIADGQSGVRAHVALLTRNPFFGGGRSPVLFPDCFQLDSGMDLHLMAGHAELRFHEQVRLNGRLMDPQVSRPVGHVGTDQDLVFHRIADGLDAARSFEGAEYRFVDVARRDPARGIDLAVALADTVATDAGDAFL